MVVNPYFVTVPRSGLVKVPLRPACHVIEAVPGEGAIYFALARVAAGAGVELTLALLVLPKSVAAPVAI